MEAGQAGRQARGKRVAAARGYPTPCNQANVQFCNKLASMMRREKERREREREGRRELPLLNEKCRVAALVIITAGCSSQQVGSSSSRREREK